MERLLPGKGPMSREICTTCHEPALFYRRDGANMVYACLEHTAARFRWTPLTGITGPAKHVSAKTKALIRRTLGV